MNIERVFMQTLSRHRRLVDELMDDYGSEVETILSANNRKTRMLYANILKTMVVDDSQRIKPTVLSNFTKLETLRRLISDMAMSLRKRIFVLANGARDSLLELTIAKERAFEEILLERGGVGAPRSKLTKKEMDVLDRMFKASIIRINVSLEKWKTFAYNAFFSGINVAMTPIDLERSLFTEDGHVKIGSSLENEIDYESTRALMEQRTQYQVGRAERLGYRVCWNTNPLDQKTKPICMSATLAGVIPKEEMLTDYGFPPRNICRCDLTFIDESWTAMAGGINSTIEERRKEAIGLLKAMPEQKTEWKIKSHERIAPSGEVVKIKRHERATTDAQRLAGKRYQTVQDRLNILQKTKVPKYEWTPLPGWKPPRDFRTLAQLIDPRIIVLGAEGTSALTDEEIRAFVAGKIGKDEIETILTGRL